MKRIYFLRPVGQPGPVKIGCSVFPERRVLDLARVSPIPLELAASGPGNHEIERRLHRMFKGSRLHMEWFAASPELSELIARFAAGLPITDLIDMSLPIKARHRVSDLPSHIFKSAEDRRRLVSKRQRRAA